MINRAIPICALVLLPLLAGASALDLYRDLVGKTLLIAPELPEAPALTLSDLPDDRPNAIAKIEDELTKSGVAVVPDGPHFIRLLPRQRRDALLQEAPLRGSELQPSPGQEILPTGMLNLPGVQLPQILTIYAELSRRTVLRPCDLPCPAIQFKTAGPLSREEAIYALKTVLAFNGIAMVDDGAALVQAVPVAQRAQITAKAPERDPKEKLFDPKKVPTVGVRKPAAPVSKLEQLEAALYQFIQHQAPPQRPAFRLLQLEAELTHRTAVASPQFDTISAWLHVETPLTQSELIYAIETTLKLGNLAVIVVDDQRIRLGHISELRSKFRE